jgi:hypothetical protein
VWRHRAVVVGLLVAGTGCADDQPSSAPAAESTSTTDAETTTTTPADPPAAGITIIGFGTSFGMCAGFCEQTLSIDGSDVELIAADRGDDELITTRGVLTDAARARLRSAAASIDPASVVEVIGCPDCADGGAAFLDLALPARHVRSSYDFGGPPTAYVEADALGRAILGAMATCTSTELVAVADDCEPVTI